MWVVTKKGPQQFENYKQTHKYQDRQTKNKHNLKNSLRLTFCWNVIMQIYSPTCPEHMVYIPTCPEHMVCIPTCSEHMVYIPTCREHMVCIPTCSEHTVYSPTCPEHIVCILLPALSTWFVFLPALSTWFIFQPALSTLFVFSYLLWAHGLYSPTCPEHMVCIPIFALNTQFIFLLALST